MRDEGTAGRLQQMALISFQGQGGDVNIESRRESVASKGSAAELHTAIMVEHEARTKCVLGNAGRAGEWPGHDEPLLDQPTRS